MQTKVQNDSLEIPQREWSVISHRKFYIVLQCPQAKNLSKSFRRTCTQNGYKPDNLASLLKVRKFCSSKSVASATYLQFFMFLYKMVIIFFKAFSLILNCSHFICLLAKNCKTQE